MQLIGLNFGVYFLSAVGNEINSFNVDLDQPSNNLGLEDIDNTIEVTNPIDGVVPNLFEDQTVNPTEEELLNDKSHETGKETGSLLELAPVNPAAEKKTVKRRVRKLIIDDVKEIDSASMKTQLSDTSNIIGQLELAPPTRRLMQLKETSGVDKMFSMTSRPLHSKTLLKVSNSFKFRGFYSLKVFRARLTFSWKLDHNSSFKNQKDLKSMVDLRLDCTRFDFYILKSKI